MSNYGVDLVARARSITQLHSAHPTAPANPRFLQRIIELLRQYGDNPDAFVAHIMTSRMATSEATSEESPGDIFAESTSPAPKQRRVTVVQQSAAHMGEERSLSPARVPQPHLELGARAVGGGRATTVADLAGSGHA